MISYLIKSILCSGILILVYRLFLEREKMFVFNRAYLLVSLLFSMLVPLIVIELNGDHLSPEAPIQHLIDPQISALTEPIISSENETLTTTQTEIYNWPFIFYSLISAALLFRFCRNIIILFKLKNTARKIDYHNANLILMPESMTPFSFLNNIFIHAETYNRGLFKSEILVHELTHVRQKHSFDLIFIELMQAFFWLNPFLFIYKKSISLNHEFLADAGVLEEFDKKNYQLLLLSELQKCPRPALGHSFNFPFNKKRFVMMNRISNLNLQYAKQAFSALLAFTLAFVFSEKIYSQTANLEEIAVTGKKTITTHEVTADEIETLKKTIEKHTVYINNGKRTDPMVKMPPALENELYKIYERLTFEQRKTLNYEGITMFQMAIPEKKHPDEKMFENWKRADIFGVWINDRKVPNSELNKYKSTDIAEYDLSKLYGAALKGRGYKYQLNLLTNERFDQTYDERVNNRVIITRAGWLNQVKKKSN